MSYRVARASTLALFICAGVTTPLHAQTLGGLFGKVTKKADSIANAKLGTPDSAVRVQRVEGPAATPASGSLWLNYDFVTGDNVLFTDNFQSPDNVGDFPKRLGFLEGNMEIAESGGARYLRLSSETGSFNVVLPQKLPEHFTLEFDFMPELGYGQEIRFTDERPASHPLHGVVTVECVERSQCNGGVRTAAAWSKADAPDAFPHQLMRVSVLADGLYAKVYLNGTRVANVPNADLGRSNHIVFDLHADAKDPTLIGPITVAGGGKSLYDALEKNKSVATHGILFDVGSDHIKPESGPTLKEIAAMLADHPSLKLTIEGHTDDQGDAAQNLALSERRAAAVKQKLIEAFKADAARLFTKGLGSTKPMTSNATAEGRLQNRRVMLVLP